MRRFIVRCLVGLRADALARLRHRGRVVVLAYHNIVPPGEKGVGDQSLHLGQEDFARQLDRLTETHDVVSLSSLLNSREGGTTRSERMRAAITFDDAYQGAVTVGIEEVVRRDLPATVFVTPTLLGEKAFWWDLLASPDTGSVEPSLREHCLSRFAGHQEKILAWAKTEGLLQRTAVPRYARSGTIDLVERAVEQPGITLGAHGWRHLSLPSCSPEDVQCELNRPLEWFEHQGLPFRPWWAYPYGRHSENLKRAVRDRYALGFTTAGEPVKQGLDRSAVPRLNIPAGISLRYFQLLTSGLIDLIGR